MAVDMSYVEFLLDQMSDIPEVEHRKMFGGVGFFQGGVMFGLLGKDKFHFRTDEENAADYEAHGMKRFMQTEKKKGLPYHEVPQEIIEDRDKFCEWAKTASSVAHRLKK